MYRDSAAGRKNISVYFSFALSLSLHGAVLFLLAPDANDVPLSFAMHRQFSPLEVRIVPPQTVRTALTVRSDSEHAINTPDTRPKSIISEETQSKASRLSAGSKLVDLNSGNLIDNSYWRDTKVHGKPVRVLLTIDPAGFLSNWQLLTQVDSLSRLDITAMSHIIRNMETDKTGETHVQVWEFQLGIKDGGLIAKIHSVRDK